MDAKSLQFLVKESSVSSWLIEHNKSCGDYVWAWGMVWQFNAPQEPSSLATLRSKQLASSPAGRVKYLKLDMSGNLL